ncbi:MAG: hypothetical protein N3G76_00230 [Candidatus Micrarchaeota archaeon]|nr:hypothetical protein [Candidatus Micrarchaeota archaeon]
MMTMVNGKGATTYMQGKMQQPDNKNGFSAKKPLEEQLSYEFVSAIDSAINKYYKATGNGSNTKKENPQNSSSSYDMEALLDATLKALKSHPLRAADTCTASHKATHSSVANPEVRSIPENARASIKSRISAIRVEVNWMVISSFKYRILVRFGIPNAMSSMVKVLDAIEAGDKSAVSESDLERVKSKEALYSFLEELADIGDPTASYFIKG